MSHVVMIGLRSDNNSKLEMFHQVEIDEDWWESLQLLLIAIFAPLTFYGAQCAQCALHASPFLLFCISELDRHLSSKQINPVILRTHCWSPNWTQQRKESPSWKGLLKVLKHCPHIGAIAVSIMQWTTLDWQELHCAGAGRGAFGASFASIWV